MAIEYERVNWDTTKYVNPTNMNQMDAGIKAACDGVDENGTQITAINSKLQPVDVDFSWGDSSLDRTYNHVKKMGSLVILNMLLYTDGISGDWNTIGTVEAPPLDAFVFNGYDSNSGECCEILIKPDKTIQVRSAQVRGYGFIRASTSYFTE